MSIVDAARSIATEAHRGQTRWDNRTPYIVHPEAVAKIVAALGGNDTAIAVAWLHDVVEDTDLTEHDIREEFGMDIAMGVSFVTHIGTETYAEYIRLLIDSGPDEAIMVKIADLTHNLSDLPSGKDGNRNKQRREKYELARLVLQKELNRRHNKV